MWPRKTSPIGGCGGYRPCRRMSPKMNCACVEGGPIAPSSPASERYLRLLLRRPSSDAAAAMNAQALEAMKNM